MAHPPQHTYQPYTMRPGPPGGQGGYAPYPPQGLPEQGQGYGAPRPGKSTIVTALERLLTSTDQPPFQTSSPPPNLQSSQGNAPPFYVAGAEVPATQQYPPRNQTPADGRQPAPINTSPPPAQTYQPYSVPMQDNNPYSQPPLNRPTSTYGAQELATSVYDSPIAPANHSLQNSATYSSSVYSPDEVANSNSFGAQHNQPPAQYQSYNPQAPPAPTEQPPQPPQNVMTPPPLQPGGPAYDSRHNLPSQSQAGGSQQYKPYVPPGEGPSAPAPNDYYRRSGVY